MSRNPLNDLFEGLTSNTSNSPLDGVLAAGSELTRALVKVNLTGAQRFVQTQVDFIGQLRHVESPDDAMQLQQRYVQTLCEGAQAHVQGLTEAFTGLRPGADQTQAEPKPAAQAAKPAPKSPQPAAAAAAAVVDPVVAEVGAPKAVADSKPKAEKTEKKVAAAKPSSAGDEIDDLTQVSGIGRVFAGKLAALGITRFSDLAGLKLEEVDRPEHPLHEYRSRIEGDEWIEQARKLAADS